MAMLNKARAQHRAAHATRVPACHGKYYTASVNFTAYPQEVFEMKESEGVEVVMYIFEGNVRLAL
jgi:hypothetical protein